MGTITECQILETTTCCVCGIFFAMPASFINKRREDKNDFYCPNGHVLVFNTSAKDQEIARLKREKDEAERSERVLRSQVLTNQAEVKKLKSEIRKCKKVKVS